MDYLVKNLRYLTSNPQLHRGQVAAGETAGIGQPAISKIITQRTKEPGYRTVMGLAKHYGVSMDDLVSRDLEEMGPSGPSQPMRLDVAKLADLVETVEAAVAQSRKQLPAKFKARVIAQLYVDDQASASPQAVQVALASILASME